MHTNIHAHIHAHTDTQVSVDQSKKWQSTPTAYKTGACTRVLGQTQNLRHTNRIRTFRRNILSNSWGIALGDVKSWLHGSFGITRLLKYLQAETWASFRPNVCLRCHILKKGLTVLNGIYLFISRSHEGAVSGATLITQAFIQRLYRILFFFFLPSFVCIEFVDCVCVKMTSICLNLSVCSFFSLGVPQPLEHRLKKKELCRTVNTFLQASLCLLPFSPLLCFLGFASVIWEDWRTNKSQRCKLAFQKYFFHANVLKNTDMGI